MTIDKNRFNSNKLFVLIIIIAIIGFILLSLLFNNNNNEIHETELETNGDSKVNKLVINEYMSSNSGTLVDSEGKAYDWIELYNGTDKDINLKNYGLSDNKNQVKWVFPEVIIEKKSYLIIYLSGTNQSGLYAPFKLKSSGDETIALKKPSGKVVDIIKTVALTKGQSAARNLNGDFIVSSSPTPGYANTKEGLMELTKSKEVENNGIRISELLAKNDGNFSINGKYPGYIEIINTTNDEISLDGYYISNDINRLYKYRIDNVTLKSNEVYTIFTGINNEDENNNYLSFNLDGKFGTIYLSNKEGKIIDKLEYDYLANGVAEVLIDNEYHETSIISPGYLNNDEGVKEFQEKYLEMPKTLVINEIMNNNTSFLAQNGYNFYDWIELYNNSEEEINLKDYTLTTTTNNIALYELPDVVLKPNEYYIIMASGDTNLSNNTYIHANFKLSDTDSLYLYKGKTVVDSMVINNVPLNYSYGRGLDNGFFYMENPTPLKQNKVGVREISFAPTFSIEAGIYNDVENVTLELYSNGDIYYTLDGSNPTTYSKKYTEPIVLTKTSVVKAATIEQGKIKSDIITKSYIINENHTIPVVSMSLNNSDFNKLIYNSWNNIEVSGNLELFEEEGGFNTPCGISLFGGSARGFSKKSFGIRFKSKYGAGSLNYKLFPNRDTSVYQSIVIRSGSQDYSNAFIRDIVGTSLVDDYTDVDVQAYKTVVLYVNGSYYGVLNVREKVNADFVANHYNVDPNKVNLLQGTNEMQSGSKVFYNNIINYVRTHNMSLDSSYEGLEKLVDIQNIIDYWIAEIYVANYDSINIRYFSHPDIDEGRMKMIFFDLDYAWYWFRTNYFTYITNPSGISTLGGPINTDLVRLSLKNSKFRTLFLERLQYNLENTWKTENVLKRIDEIYEKFLPEMERNQKRWGLSLANWKNEVESLREFAKKRPSYIMQQARSFFGMSRDEYNKYFGGIS